MSKCPCGGETRKYVQEYEQSPRSPFNRCIKCGFSWGVKE